VGKMEHLTSQALLEALARMCKAIELSKGYLCELDAATGDGDHGVSMAKSFRAVADELPALAGQSIEAILRAVGMSLVSTVGGAMGPLFGTAFLKAAEKARNYQEIDLPALAEMFAAAEEGIVSRGIAKPGDKTMLDAIHPAVATIKHAVERNRSICQAVRLAAQVAKEGAEATKVMVANVGRASRLGERTLGHQDPGAVSASILLGAAGNSPGN